MKKLDSKITSYMTGHEDFIIDIIKTSHTYDEPMYETWLYRENVGNKIFVVGEAVSTYSGMTIRQYAQHIIDYISIVWDSGYNFYDIYDEEIEDIEEANNERLEAERNN